MSSGPGAGDARDLEDVGEAYRRVRDAPPDEWGTLGDPEHLAFVQQVELALVRALSKAHVDLSAASVLDVGCGAGYYSQRLSVFGARSVTGVDVVPELVADARAHHAGIAFEVASATHLPFADDSFDLATQFTCLSSIVDPRSREQAAREIVRVLRPGGHFVSFDMRPAPRLLQLVRKLSGRGPAQGPITVAPLELAELRQLFPGELVSSVHPALHPGILCRVVNHPLALGLLSGLPPLRSHLLVVLRPGAD